MKMVDVKGAVLYYLIYFLIFFEISFDVKLLTIVKLGKKVRPVTFNLLRKEYIIFLLLFIVIFSVPYLSPLIEKHFSDKNKKEISSLVYKIIGNETSDTEKMNLILQWISRNMKNIYGKSFLFQLAPLDIYLSDPFICLRIVNHNYSYWILTSKCGACEEYSLLFRELAFVSGLKVRSVHASGENHNWDEVFINGKWVIIDPTGYLPHNITPTKVESFIKRNISKLIAEYPNGTREDITSRYTNVSSILFIAVDENGKTLSNIDIIVLSNNWMNDWEVSNANCTTSQKGECMITIGGGNYDFLALSKDSIPLYYRKDGIIIEENKNYTFKLILSKNFWYSRSPIVRLINHWVFVVYIWFALTFLIETTRGIKKSIH